MCEKVYVGNLQKNMELNKPHPQFVVSFPYPIWQIKWDTSLQQLGIETRHPSLGIPYLFNLDVKKGELLQNNVTLGDRNWTLVSAWNGLWILRKVGQDTPYSIGIQVLDSRTGEKIWEAPHLRFVGHHHDILTCRTSSVVSGPVLKLDVYTGQPVSSTTKLSDTIEDSIETPRYYDAEPPPLLSKYTPLDGFHHLTWEDKALWTFQYVKKCEISSDIYVRWVLINNGEIMFDADLLGPLKKMLPEILFKIKNQVFLVGDNKRDFVSYLV
jgi:hypothetical protein